MRGLAERFRVIRYDHRGHGGSPVPPGPYDSTDLAGDLVALLDRLGVARAHVCGASLGGQVAIRLAAHAPGRVDRVVLCCTSPVFGPPALWLERAKTVRAEGTGPSPRGRRPLVHSRVRRDEPEVVERFRAMIASTPSEGYAACCEAVGGADLGPDLGAIRAPTLRDRRRAGPGRSRRAHAGARGRHRRFPRSRSSTRGATSSNVERADRVTELIIEHLTSEPGMRRRR